MTDRSRIIETIAKMSRLTEDTGAFEGEISNAAARIQELMEKYSISQLDIQNFKADQQEKEFAEVFRSKTSEFQHKAIQEWHWQLARIIARITMTRHYSYGKRMTFFGVEANAKVAADLYELWLRNIGEMAEQARRANLRELKRKYGRIKQLRHHIRDVNPDENPQYFRASWIRGCLHAISMKLHEEEQAREANREKGSTPNDPDKDSDEFTNGPAVTNSALVLYRGAIDKAYSEMSKDFKHVHTKGSKGWSSSGYAQGKAAGEKIKIGSKELGG